MDLSSNSVLFLTILVLGCASNALAIDCWVCNSDSDPTNCGETINDIGLQDAKSTASNCAACGKYFKSLGTVFTYVERSCLTSESDTCDNKMGYGYCTCSTTYCNGQERISLTTPLVLLTTVCVVLFKYL
ncbi:uncharacterized protein LOC134270203 [Saccostrea cucullata]|uniref:uncharacterized protein LOC134270203 n=1 Tax=Saccostrea cuccullata TaxID=36930 RepID=UPI002ED491AB